MSKDMNETHVRFLESLKSSLTGAAVSWREPLPPQQWLDLFNLAQAHHVLPMIFEAVYGCEAARQADPRLMMSVRRSVMQSVMMQTMKNEEFARLFAHLRAAGITPLVVKGIVCRDLYPNPDYRMSGDEDVLIPPEQFAACDAAMAAFGMRRAEPEQDAEAVYEVPYGKPGSPIYIELHKSLFPPDSDAYGDFNRFFEDVHARAKEMTIGGAQIATMDSTDHFFYLICHAFKHFLHSGFGIRQVSDMALFANRYGQEIDWAAVRENCRAIRAEHFVAALLRIGEEYLTLDVQKAGCPRDWMEMDVDVQAMLEDLLDAGVYGDGSMSRKHSSTITLNAVSASKQGKEERASLLKTVFPAAKALEGRFPYLKKRPWLLPAAWITRILHYRRETSRTRDNDALSAMKIGSERVELLRKFKVIR